MAGLFEASSSADTSEELQACMTLVFNVSNCGSE